MKSISTKKLETKRLILRRFDFDDAERMYEAWASDDEVTKFLTWPTHDNVEVTRMITSMWVNNYHNLDFYQWAIVLKETDELLGSISVVHLSKEDESAEIGYCISRKHWNKGITTEALKRVIEFMFDEVEVKKVKACHDKDNPASGKVMTKAGMKYTHQVIGKNNSNDKCICLYYAIEKIDCK